MNKRMIAVVVAAGIGMMAFAMRSTTAVAKDNARPETVTQAQIDAVVDARLHQLLRQKIAEAHARAEGAASEE